MIPRSELLHSSVRLLYQDQQHVTDAFAGWAANEHVRRHESVRPVVTAVLCHLQRDLDRIYVLVQSYPPLRTTERNGPAAGSEAAGLAPRSLPSSRGRRKEFPTPSLGEILRRSCRALDELSVRYASVYFVATVLAEPPSQT